MGGFQEFRFRLCGDNIRGWVPFSWEGRLFCRLAPQSGLQPLGFLFCRGPDKLSSPELVRSGRKRAVTAIDWRNRGFSERAVWFASLSSVYGQILGPLAAI